jgi:hypothetical protein
MAFRSAADGSTPSDKKQESATSEDENRRLRAELFDMLTLLHVHLKKPMPELKESKDGGPSTKSLVEMIHFLSAEAKAQLTEPKNGISPLQKRKVQNAESNKATAERTFALQPFVPQTEGKQTDRKKEEVERKKHAEEQERLFKISKQDTLDKYAFELREIIAQEDIYRKLFNNFGGHFDLSDFTISDIHKQFMTAFETIFKGMNDAYSRFFTLLFNIIHTNLEAIQASEVGEVFPDKATEKALVEVELILKDEKIPPLEKIHQMKGILAPVIQRIIKTDDPDSKNFNFNQTTLEHFYAATRGHGVNPYGVICGLVWITLAPGSAPATDLDRMLLNCIIRLDATKTRNQFRAQFADQDYLLLPDRLLTATVDFDAPSTGRTPFWQSPKALVVDLDDLVNKNTPRKR